MAPRKRITRDAILAEATAIVVAKGPSALTFQSLASRLGVTKQAVIYWYPSKQDLARDLTLPAIRAEADATIGALAGAIDARSALDRFARALIAHHLADLPRFRFMYLASQLDEQAPVIMEGIAEEAHAITSAMYGALEARLAADPSIDPRRPGPRRLAVAAHAAALGLVMMVSLADAVGDPLAHPTDALVDALVHLLAHGL